MLFSLRTLMLINLDQKYVCCDKCEGQLQVIDLYNKATLSCQDCDNVFEVDKSYFKDEEYWQYLVSQSFDENDYPGSEKDYEDYYPSYLEIDELLFGDDNDK